MITTVIILKSTMRKMTISDNNDNETMNAEISLHIYIKSFLILGIILLHFLKFTV